MWRSSILAVAVAACAIATPIARAAEHRFDFSQVPEGQTPPGFRSAVAGVGKPGEWKVVFDDVAPALAPLSPKAPTVTKRPVLAQLAQDPTDEHFPMLIYQEETYTDFTLSTRFKTVRGALEQMAGLAFRIQNESNFYVLRASTLGNTFRFYKVVNGQRQPEVIAANVKIPNGVWQELSVECLGNSIHCRLNGKELIPALEDRSFSSGKVGFWTKSDSVSYFCDAKILYTPREPPAQKIVRDLIREYPRLLGLKIYVRSQSPGATRLVASKEAREIGQPGTKTEIQVITRAETFYGKEKDVASVIMPLRDRNGDAIAAARVVMKSFPGQTEENAIVRAAPIVKQIQARVLSLDDLVEPAASP